MVIVLTVAHGTLFTHQNVCQRSTEMLNDITLCFVDTRKPSTKLIHLLDGVHVDKILVQGLYYNQTATTLVRYEVSEVITIENGVRQGCVIPHDLFCIYREIIMRSLDA